MNIPPIVTDTDKSYFKEQLKESIIYTEKELEILLSLDIEYLSNSMTREDIK